MMKRKISIEEKTETIPLDKVEVIYTIVWKVSAELALESEINDAMDEMNSIGSAEIIKKELVVKGRKDAD